MAEMTDREWAEYRPVSEEREWDVLACLLFAPELVPATRRLVGPADFSTEDTVAVYSAICRLNDRRVVPDATAVDTELRNSGAERRLVLEVLDADRHRTMLESIPFHARHIRSESLHRRLRAFGSDLASDPLPPEDPVAWIAQAEHELRSLADEASDTQETDRPEDTLSRIMDRLDAHGELAPAVATGLHDLDRLLDGGLRGGQMYVVAARAGTGKTSLACNVTLRHLQAGATVLFVSVEMSDEQILLKLMSDATSQTLRQLQRPDSFVAAMGAPSEWRYEIMHGRPLTVVDVGARARTMRRVGLDLVVVDYIQRLHPVERRGNREAEVAEMSSALKQIAIDHDVPVLALSQLRRPGAGQKAAKPTIDEVRESGAIENDADAVLLLHRDRIDNPTWASGLLVKNRFGPEGEFDIVFRPELGRFENP